MSVGVVCIGADLKGVHGALLKVKASLLQGDADASVTVNTHTTHTQRHTCTCVSECVCYMRG